MRVCMQWYCIQYVCMATYIKFDEKNNMAAMFSISRSDQIVVVFFSMCTLSSVYVLNLDFAI